MDALKGKLETGRVRQVIKNRRMGTGKNSVLGSGVLIISFSENSRDRRIKIRSKYWPPSSSQSAVQYSVATII